VSSSIDYLSPSQAARRLGVSAKALRIYEARGVLTPVRTTVGWRVYGPDELARAAKVASLRRLGLSLGRIARVLAGDPGDLEPALASHQAVLEDQVHKLALAVQTVRGVRANLAKEHPTAGGDLGQLSAPPGGVSFSPADRLT
jgi:DNA-binding transcriptional MerR regulator